MRRRFSFVSVLPFALALAFAAPAAAQQFDAGLLYAGPRVWVGNLNGTVAFGGQLERGFTKPGDVGPGIIAAGAGIDFYRWSSDLTVGRYSYSVVPIQLFGNYHFLIAANRRFDPYVGLALVYQVVSASWDGPGTGGATSSGSGAVFAGQAGLRYFMSPRFAFQGQVGFGYGTLGLGATMRL
jgi:hypothetical protein